MRQILSSFLSLFASKKSLRNQIKALVCRKARDKEAIDCLTRQRDTLIDTLDALQWGARREAVIHKAAVAGMKKPGDRDHV